MARDDEPTGVDFVVGSFDPGTDEELAQPPERRRIWLPLISGAVVATLVVVALVSRHSGEQPAAAPVTPAVPAPTVEYPRLHYALGSEVRVNPLTGAIVNIRNGEVVGEAPTKLGTTHHSSVPRATAAVLRRTFSDVHAIRVVTVIAQRNGTLRQRQIRARGGGFALRIDVRPATSGDSSRSRATESDARVTTVVRALLRGYLIRVRAVASGDHSSELTVLRRLAFDRRLLSTR